MLGYKEKVPGIAAHSNRQRLGRREPVVSPCARRIGSNQKWLPLGGCLHRFAFSIAQRDAANLFLACEWIFNRQLRVEAITPAPKPAHGLLASVDHFCKSGAMRLSIREFAFGLACDGFGMPLSRKSWPPFVRPNHVA